MNSRNVIHVNGHTLLVQASRSRRSGMIACIAAACASPWAFQRCKPRMHGSPPAAPGPREAAALEAAALHSDSGSQARYLIRWAILICMLTWHVHVSCRGDKQQQVKGPNSCSLEALQCN